MTDVADGWREAESLIRERNDAKARIKALSKGLVQYEHTLSAVEAERDVLRALLRDALERIPIDDAGYPADNRAFVDRAKAALEA